MGSAAPSWLPQALFAPYFSSICADFNVDMLSYFPLVLCVGVFGCLRHNILSHWGSFGVLRDDICFISYHHGGHSVAHPKQPRTSYSPSQLRSFRKSSSKQRLKADLWKTLGELGIRKPFRSKRKKVQSSSVDGSLPVVSDTGTPQSSLTRCCCEAYTGLPVVRATENQKALNCVVLKYSIPVSEEQQIKEKRETLASGLTC